MAADALTEMIVARVLAPAAVAFAVAWFASRPRSPSIVARSAVVVALLSGFWIGYVLLPDWAALKPTRHWHWLPWVASLAGFTGSLGVRSGPPIRCLLFLATSVAAAWCLVPTWASLAPPRIVWLIALSAGLCLLLGLTDPLPTRLGGRLVLGVVCLTAVTVAAMIAVCISVTYAQVAGLTACALGGAWGGSLRAGRDEEPAVRAALPAALILVAGIAFIGCVEPERPQYGLLLLPAAPLGLWVCRLPALARLTGRTATVVRIASVAVPLLAAAAVSYARLL